MFKRTKTRWGIQIDKLLWGPLLLLSALVVFLVVLGRSGPVSLLHYVGVSLSGILFLAGISLMLLQLGPTVPVDPVLAGKGIDALQDVSTQLSKNYEMLRRQTSQALVVTLTLMTLGVLVILAASFGWLFGFTDKGNALASAAGIISELISGTALWVYKANFDRLNRVSDRLEYMSRLITAYSLADSLPPEQKAQATLALIEAMTESGTMARSAEKADMSV